MELTMGHAGHVVNQMIDDCIADDRLLAKWEATIEEKGRSNAVVMFSHWFEDNPGYSTRFPHTYNVVVETAKVCYKAMSDILDTLR